MAINLAAANEQARQTRMLANNLRDVRASLDYYRNNLQENWQGIEVESINRAIDNTLSELLDRASDLDSVGSDINAVAQEIRAEELAAARAREASQ